MSRRTLRPERGSTIDVATRLALVDRAAYAISWIQWVAFHMAPIPIGFVVAAVLDRVAGPDPTSVTLLLAAVIALEIGRWTLLLSASVQWHGAWVGWITVPRVHMLRSAAVDAGPADTKLPSSPGEAVSRFRDDADDLGQVLDVWLDISGSGLAAAGALVVVASVSPAAAVACVIPTALALAASSVMAPALRRWRRAARNATAEVTAFIGDTYAGILAIKTNAAEDAAVSRFRALNERRADTALRDEIGSELVRALGYGTGEIAIGVVLVAVASAFSAGDLTVGDVALLAAYAPIVAGVAKWAGRMGVYHRQADVSVGRLAELTTSGDPVDLVRPVDIHLRSGPPPHRPVRIAAEPLQRLDVVGLTVVADERIVLDGVTLSVAAGETVVVTGEVGSGKSTLLRAVLGLTTVTDGTISWNGRTLEDPSVEMVPPRVAYVPQVPRLFSESLADTVLLGEDPDGLAAALSDACLDDDLARMPAGVDTLVGPRGVRLSGGQVQRAAAARALARPADLLVVDDLSSALDVVTEAELWRRLDRRGHKAALVVSHRPAVIEAADRVIVLEGGRVRAR